MAAFFLGASMRSLFWRILGAFWLALILTGALTFLLTRLINQDSWILAQHPGLSHLGQQWLVLYEYDRLKEAHTLLQGTRQKHHIYTQVFDEDGILLSASTRARRQPRAPNISRTTQGDVHSNWRRLTQEVTSEHGQTFLFVHRIPRNALTKWQYGYGYGALLIALAAVLVLTLVSLLLTFSITRPLMRLRHAVHELGQTAYQQQHLVKLAQRKDELGVLAADFNKMGQHLQNMLSSQRQLLRDVSHELRSPLARLQVGIALAERAPLEKQHLFWPKLSHECERLDALIDEILVLARLEQESPKLESFELCELLAQLRDDCALLAPEQQLEITCTAPVHLHSVKALLQRALDNLLRNAVRFNPAHEPIQLEVSATTDTLCISIRDQGPGVATELLDKITQPFTRAAQQSPGYGLGLTITERAIEQLNGKLILANHPHKGFIATIELPA